ncbi:N-formylglutamate amidohydrolase [Litoribaculum gwangyangense]|uniref:N-formylglutamate amidohydrolase n=1 Tax=Litoribaculum gwangyangense TaxID=1130722 RepID=A0ABP9CVH3_9FLAO
MKLILTCEHGGNKIPKDFEKYFNDSQVILNSHRGYDIGALDVFKTLKSMSDFSKYSEISRLLIELNRSLHHPKLFSEFTKPLSKAEKEHLITTYYLPYRTAVETEIKQWITKNETVLHFSIHSFTPVLNEQERHCDVGLLFDSTLKNEKQFCVKFKKELKTLNPKLQVRFNYPYLGKSDGFTTYLRKQFKENYLGIEIEINQKHRKNNRLEPKVKEAIVLSTKNCIA